MNFFFAILPNREEDLLTTAATKHSVVSTKRLHVAPFGLYMELAPLIKRTIWSLRMDQ